MLICSDAKSLLTLCDPMDCNPPRSPVHRISQARILGWIAISFSRGSSWPRDWWVDIYFITETPGKPSVSIDFTIVKFLWMKSHSMWSFVTNHLCVCLGDEGERGEWKAGLKLSIQKLEIMAWVLKSFCDWFFSFKENLQQSFVLMLLCLIIV